MSVERFSAALAKAVGPGATWHKVDFHVHMPGSADYEYREPDAIENLGRTLSDNQYSIAVVVKHQEFPSPSELAALQTRCPRTTLIPGAELNILVDALFKKIGKDYFFHCILAVDPADGDYGYLLRKARHQFSYRDSDHPAGFRSSVIDLGRFFRNEGGLFIPAHLHQSKDPATSRSIDDLYEDDAFLGFVAEGAFNALEVRQRSTAAYFDGTKTTTDGFAIPASVCVSSSDAHHHNHIGERLRATWLRMEKATFQELGAALSFRHRVLLNAPIVDHARVLGMHVVGTFVPDLWVAFNDGLNALIGSKGSGKTALLECLRFVLNTPVPGDRADNIRRHIAHVLGSSGYVEALAQLPTGERLLISRRADSPDRITVTDSSGNSTARGIQEPVAFPISILGWHEIEQVAENADARISLLDRVGDPATVRQHYDDISRKIEHARDQMPILQRQVKRLDTGLRDLWELRRKRASLRRLEQGEMLALQQQYEWYLLTEQRLDNLAKSATDRYTAIPQALSSRLSSEATWPHQDPLPVSVAETLDAVAGALASNQSAESESAATLQAAMQAIHAAAHAGSESLAAAFATFRDSVYTPRVNALPPDDREILTRQIQVLEETKRLPVVEQQCQDLLHSVGTLAVGLRGVCDAILAEREAIVQERKALVTGLNNSLQGVRLRFLRSSSQSGRQRFQSRYGAEGGQLLSYLQSFGNTETYQNLRAIFDKLAGVSLDQDSWNVQATLWDARLAELFDILDEDDIEIALEVGKAGYVAIQNLSAGQRCVAVFPLLLRNSKGPLVIDQPEDNLDNRYIADFIAPDLCDRKQNQQFIVTSHNANLVVLTDADLIVHLDSDGAKCSSQAAGFLACPISPVRDSVLAVLDGGEAALAARQRKYGTHT